MIQITRMNHHIIVHEVDQLMPTYHTQPQPTWRDKFTERELRLINNARTYVEHDPTCRSG